jgi:uncharacterized protein (DUF924 family)
MSPADVTQFWTDAGPKAWFAKDAAFDEAIRARFEALHHRAARRELDLWADQPEGALALLLLLDQFPRNLYRGSAHAFATDPLARQVADRAIAAGHDLAQPPDLQLFFYLPFEHSEHPADQARSVALIKAHAARTGDADLLKWARVHADIIARFGRFPHRNRELGRTDTEEEIEFLRNGGFAG